jgi:hypothetical protein
MFKISIFPNDFHLTFNKSIGQLVKQGVRNMSFEKWVMPIGKRTILTLTTVHMDMGGINVKGIDCRAQV